MVDSPHNENSNVNVGQTLAEVPMWKIRHMKDSIAIQSINSAYRIKQNMSVVLSDKTMLAKVTMWKIGHAI